MADKQMQVSKKQEVQQTGESPKAERQFVPSVDIFETEKEVRVVAELPGVDKKDIKLHGTEDSLTISVSIPQYKYYNYILCCK